jgi:ABC-type Mn2+/Zn2+ transport system ATPase subunit
VDADLLLQLDNVTVGYPRHVVLAGVNLAIRRGTFTGLLGSNGSGKTTLLKTIVGIIPPLEGKVAWNPEVRIGYVPQRDVLDSIFLLSSLEVVLMATKSEKHWALECMEATGSADLARKRFSELSGGQKQRVLIARALATRPEFLALDEPTAGIDPAAASAIMELLEKIHQKRLTILMVSHDLALMRGHAERVIWLHNGQLTEGPAEQMLSRERVLEIFELDLG